MQEDTAKAIYHVETARGGVYPFQTASDGYALARQDFLRQLHEGGLTVIRTSRIRDVEARQVVPNCLLIQAADGVVDAIVREVGVKLGKGIADVLPVHQRDLGPEWPGGSCSEFSVVATVILPEAG